MFSSIASVLGNRNQAGYNIGNAFLNALTTYRRSHDLPGVAIALGAMTDIGVLHELLGEKEHLLATLARSGLTRLQKDHLDKIMEAAMLVSQNKDFAADRDVILTGLEMFERVDGKLVGEKDQNMLHWTELPGFGNLQVHQRSWGAEGRGAGQGGTLRERIEQLDDAGAAEAIRDAF